MTAAGAAHLCQRQIDPPAIWSALCSGTVTHLCAAPTVLTMIAEAAASSGGGKVSHPVHAFTGGAPPTPALLARLAALNLRVTHLYGLTETYGPSVINDWQPEWAAKSESEKARLNARQGVGNVVTREIGVIHASGEEVPADGETLGHLGYSARDGDERDRMLAQLFDHAADETAHVDQRLTSEEAVRKLYELPEHSLPPPRKDGEGNT